MFSKDERGGFKYWFAHWCAFQMVALNHRAWHPRYLFHDIEKPWLMFILRDYKKVQHFHRYHAKHHIEYYEKYGKLDIEAMLIDWEASKFTKSACPLGACEEYNKNISRFDAQIQRQIEIQIQLLRFK